MKCPVCSQRLKTIQDSEYVCDNEDCALNKELRAEGYSTYYEFYRLTQREINEQVKDEEVHKK